MILPLSVTEPASFSQKPKRRKLSSLPRVREFRQPSSLAASPVCVRCADDERSIRLSQRWRSFALLRCFSVADEHAAEQRPTSVPKHGADATSLSSEPTTRLATAFQPCSVGSGADQTWSWTPHSTTGLSRVRPGARDITGYNETDSADRNRGRHLHPSGMEQPSMPAFRIVSDLQPTGDQPQAIEEIVAGLNAGMAKQTLLGVTGSGKTFTMANVIERIRRRWCWRTAGRSPPSFTASSRNSSRTAPSSTSCPTTTTISRKPISRSGISTSRKMPASTRRSTGCGCWRPAPWFPGGM